MPKRIVIAGGTGLVGRALENCFQSAGDDVAVLTRGESSGNQVHWDGETTDGWLDRVDGCDVVVNLAGDNLAAGRWTAAKKQRIIDSRICSTKAVAAAIEQVKKKPRLLLQASAIGFYGDRGDEDLDENSALGHGFLADTCKKWEEALGKLETPDTRVVIMRLGVVLDRKGGIVKKLVGPFKGFVGGHLGSGSQWLSWIHIKDVVGAVEYFIHNENLAGIYNITSPYQATSREFSKCLGKVLRRPSWLHMPAFAARAIFGDMADQMLLAGQKVSPRRLLDAGYSFQFSDLNRALEDIL
jgi:hypothetical protein